MDPQLRREDHTGVEREPCHSDPRDRVTAQGGDRPARLSMTSHGFVRSYDEWFPEQKGTTFVTAAEVPAGTVVVWNYKPLLIVKVEEISFANWPDGGWTKSWKDAGEPDPTTWEGRPLYIHNRPDGTNEAARLGKSPANWQFLVLPEHYAVCHRCGELPPCREVFTDRVMAVESQRIEFEMTLTIGCCHACGKPVTAREHTVLFPGDNLVRPDLGQNTAVFHTRKECVSVALSYETRWLSAEAGREPRIRSRAHAQTPLAEGDRMT